MEKDKAVVVFLREATYDDLELMMAWRSHPSVYQGLYQQDSPLRWEEHLNWWMTRKNWKIWIIHYQESNFYPRSVGVVTVQYLDTASPEVGYYVGEVTLWSKGVVTKAINQAIMWLRKKGYKEVTTTILKSNYASIRVAEKLGFKCSGNAREGELAFRKDLAS